jgi:hypothetical protein
MFNVGHLLHFVLFAQVIWNKMWRMDGFTAVRLWFIHAVHELGGHPC